jgi:hypothetical protein
MVFFKTENLLKKIQRKTYIDDLHYKIPRSGQGTSEEKFLNSSEDPSPMKQNIRGVNLEVSVGIFPTIC